MMFNFTALFFGLLLLAVGTQKCYSLANNTLQVDTEYQQKDDRIIGGTGVPQGQASFMASLRALTDVHFCGAVIISTRFVLTSGLCTAGRAANGIYVVVGTVLLASGGITHRSAAIISHPGFRSDTLQNDISLVYTATVIAFTNDVQPVEINKNVNVPDNSEASVYGWGLYTETGEHTVNYLHTLTTYTISNEDCVSNLTGDNPARINDNKLCASSGKGYGPCFGDEGGPLIAYVDIPFAPPSPQLIGILSWHVSCAAGFPDVYERISHYALWILSNI